MYVRKRREGGAGRWDRHHPVFLAAFVGLIPFFVSVVTSPIWLAKGAHRQRRIGASTENHF